MGWSPKSIIEPGNSTFSLIEAIVSSRAILSKLSVLFINATLFAYSNIAVCFFVLYGVLVRFLGHSSGNCFDPSHVAINLSLAAIIWASSFCAFLLPVPSACFLTWNLYRYWFLGDAQTQFLLLMVGYVLSVVISLIARIFLRSVFRFSPGAWIFKDCYRSENVLAKEFKRHEPRRFLKSLITSEFVEILQLAQEKFRGNQHLLKEADSQSSYPNNFFAKTSAILILLSMALSLGLSSLWKLPLQLSAWEFESNLPLPSGPEDVPSSSAVMSWLYIGEGSRAMELAKTEISRESSSLIQKSKMARVNKLVAAINLADRAGYCDSAQWHQVSQILVGLLSNSIATIDKSSPSERAEMHLLARYLRDGNEKHGFFSDADTVDSLNLEAYRESSGKNSTSYIDSLYDSALFHLRINDRNKAGNQFKAVVELCESNMDLFESFQKEAFTRMASESRSKLISLKESSAH